MRGFLILGEIAERTPTLDVECGQCDRHGRYRTADLVRAHGPEKPVPEWLREVSADCPRRIDPGQSITTLCGVRCPTLWTLFRVGR